MNPAAPAWTAARRVVYRLRDRIGDRIAEQGWRTFLREGIGTGILIFWGLNVIAWSRPRRGGEDEFGGLNTSLAAQSVLEIFAPLIVAALFWAPPLVPIVAAPLTRLIDSLFLGEPSRDPPPLSYAVGEQRMAEERWDDAADEFDRITRIFPHEERACRLGIEAALRAGDRALVRRLRRRARVFCPDAPGDNSGDD